MNQYQNELMFTTQIKPETPPPQPRPTRPAPRDEVGKQIVAAMFARMKSWADNGGWFCDNCIRETEPIESDHGQPKVCCHCRSPRIAYNPPMHLACGSTLIQPGDL